MPNHCNPLRKKTAIRLVTFIILLYTFAGLGLSVNYMINFTERIMKNFLVYPVAVILMAALFLLAACERGAEAQFELNWDGPLVHSVVRNDMHNPNSLIDVPMLMRIVERAADNFVILDVSPNPEDVIPTAIWIDRSTLLRNFEGNFNASQPFEVLVSIFEANGIGNDTTVIVYDNANGMHAGRFFWWLRAMGHPDVRLLDGGLRAWEDSGQPLQAMASPPPPPARFTATNNLQYHYVGLAHVLYAQTSPAWTILDTRSPGEFNSGRIPGAILLSYIGDFINPDFTFRTLAEYEQSFAGLSRDTGLILYCGGGLRSAVAYFVFTEILNWPQPVRMYEGGWNNWSWAGAPVEN